jgi:hypothetical protein
MAQYINIDFNIPLEIALKYSTPLPVKSKSGSPLAMFTCTDGRKLYVPPVAGNEIAKLNPKPGDKIRLLKARADSGATLWIAERVNGQPVTQLLSKAEDLTDPHGLETPSKPVTKLEDALKTAVAAAAAAEKYGREIGYAVRFAPQDIKAMGISVYIGTQRSAA